MTSTLEGDSYRSPLLGWSGAVAADGVDAGVAWHYGDPLREQRMAAASCGLLDQSNRGVLLVSGPDRLGWLHSICSQHVSQMSDGQSTQALVLSPKGHAEQHWVLTELDDQVWLDTEPGAADDVLAYLLKMRFMKRVDPTIVTAEFAVLSLIGPNAAEVLAAAGLPVPDGRAIGLPDLPKKGFVRQRPDGGLELLIDRTMLEPTARRIQDAGATPMGTWAASALRIEQRQPRLAFDTDHRTIAHEVGWIGSAVHLDKGCYRGQETVARVQNLGKPPRRLVLLHLSGDSDQLPGVGTPIEKEGRSVGFLGTAAHHHELGPIALGVIKRNLPPGESLTVAGQPVAIDPADTVPV
jgi:folate-binding protein YgfZ